MAPVALTALAVLLVAAPPLMARLVWFRQAPRPALVVWQAVALAAVVSALAAAPSAIPLLTDDLDSQRALRTPVVVLGVAVSTLILGRLLVSGHRVGTRLRAARRTHRDLVDVLANGTDGTTDGGTDGALRVLAHATPTAYCVPGRRQRVVLSEGALRELPPQELLAVMAHERAHLRARHDLVLEYFTVLHEAVPRVVRADAALVEVRLLIEVLADRAARREVGELPLARALVRLAGGVQPEATLGTGGTQSATAARMALLARAEPAVWLSLAMYAFALAVVALPILVLGLAL